MIVMVSIPRQKYRYIRSHLFKGHKEQGCFLFTDTHLGSGIINLYVKEVHCIKADNWSHQSDYHLELDDEEKVKVMLMAKKTGYDLIECHSHRFSGPAHFSHTDLVGLDEFVKYVWWKLPGRIYGAFVWTDDDLLGQVWLPKKHAPITVREIRIINK
ncbi:MAG: hypothetical protein KJ880_04180 [Candidatus Omnitrophica bacterium]|nr:hypothetical protein [Candidatus Omnitrophota bacterium]